MPMLNDRRISFLHEWFTRHSDPHRWASLRPRGSVSARATRAAQSRPEWPSERLLMSHLSGDNTLYYQCRPTAPVHALLLAFEPMTSGGDELDLSDHILSLLPGCYRERSEDLSGFDVYVHVDVGETPVQQVQASIEILGTALSAIAEENNYGARVELRGARHWAKAPRLIKRDAALQAIAVSPVFPLSNVRRVVEAAPVDLNLAGHWDDCFVQRVQPPQPLQSAA